MTLLTIQQRTSSMSSGIQAGKKLPVKLQNGDEKAPQSVNQNTKILFWDTQCLIVYEYSTLNVNQCQQVCTDPSCGSKCWKCVVDTDHVMGQGSVTDYECQHVIYAPNFQASLQTYSSCSEMCEPVALGGDDD